MSWRLPTMSFLRQSVSSSSTLYWLEGNVLWPISCFSQCSVIKGRKAIWISAVSPQFRIRLKSSIRYSNCEHHIFDAWYTAIIFMHRSSPQGCQETRSWLRKLFLTERTQQLFQVDICYLIFQENADRILMFNLLAIVCVRVWEFVSFKCSLGKHWEQILSVVCRWSSQGMGCLFGASGALCLESTIPGSCGKPWIRLEDRERKETSSPHWCFRQRRNVQSRLGKLWWGPKIL